MSGKEQLARELHKHVIKKLLKRQVYARFKDNTSAADLAETEYMSWENENITYLLCVMDPFAKYTNF